MIRALFLTAALCGALTAMTIATTPAHADGATILIGGLMDNAGGNGGGFREIASPTRPAHPGARTGMAAAL